MLTEEQSKELTRRVKEVLEKDFVKAFAGGALDDEITSAIEAFISDNEEQLHYEDREEFSEQLFERINWKVIVTLDVD